MNINLNNPAQSELDLIHANIAVSQANLDNLPKKELRGLSLDTLQHFHCGYIEKHNNPKNIVEYEKKVFDGNTSSVS